MDAVAALATRRSEELLVDYRFPHIAESHLILSPAAWNLIADIDLLQASVAGSRTWERNAEGALLRAQSALRARVLARHTTDHGLLAAADRLLGLAEVIESADRA
jgi:hypothetical protein